MEHANQFDLETFDLETMVSHLSHLLPAQGPIGVFVHHNTLHAFQHMPFEDAVVAAAGVFGAEPYLQESDYRAAFERGRIRQEDLDVIIASEGHDVELRQVMLQPGIRRFDPSTIHWDIDNTPLLQRWRADIPVRAICEIHSEAPRAHFAFWRERVPVPESRLRLPVRPRDGVLDIGGQDLDQDVHPLLIQLCGAFLDQGVSYWPMPKRESGFWVAAVHMLAQPGFVAEARWRELSKWTMRLRQLPALDALERCLELLGISPEQQEAALRHELLALPGWAGMFAQLEEQPSLAPHLRLNATLLDFLAVRMLLTVAAVDASGCGLREWQRPSLEPSIDPEALRLVRAATYFDAAQLLGLPLRRLTRMSRIELDRFERAVDQFDDWERRRVWHLAYERRHERQVLLPLRSHVSTASPDNTARVAAQVFFCIDEREESLRRHLEEVDASVETFGAAGFYGVAMQFAGADDAAARALCPVVVKPMHEVRERAADGQQDLHAKRKTLRRVWAWVARNHAIGSRSLVRGAIGTVILGSLSIFPLLGRVLSPRRYGKWMQWLNASFLPEPRTELAFMREDAAGHKTAMGLLPGFTIQEKVDIIARVLGPAGLRKAMARLVVVLGHGSTSLNNPHESAYECGACGGHKGGPNARIFAAMANHPAVREGLRQKEIYIPEDTRFVGGYHDTCSDNITLFDLEDLPSTHEADLNKLRANLDQARSRSAHERTRRFSDHRHLKTPAAGLHHVEERSEHIAEPRPEYGHGTNAVAIVGRRSTTRGLFLDRRAFLVSYDATQDPTDSGLAAVLGAVIPVCGGISLEYYFSTVDNERYGCGTKLPHNVSGLVGVMNGFSSDLRTGLASQTVEIHEPVRILFVVETTPERLLKVVRANPLLWEFLNQRWIRLAVMDPADGARILMYRGNGEWEPVVGSEEKLYEAPSSFDWYSGREEHLPIARIASAGKVRR